MRVAIFVGTRADLGPLGPVIAAFAARSDIELHILGGVAFDAAALTEQVGSVGYGGPVTALAEPMTEVDIDAILRQGALLTEGARAFFGSSEVDVLLVLGDRWELLYIVPAAVLHGIRIVHVHGGEVTEGAVDERVRHAVTKLADMHCVASADAADRVAQLGESHDRIRVTGAPGLDRLVDVPRLLDEELAAEFGTFSRPLGLFTYHPPTADDHVPLEEWTRNALLGSLDALATIIVTDPGMDAGRDAILQVLDASAAEDSRIVRVRSLGPLYPAVLASVDVVVGNSSSGVIEAASARTASVDIGRRQEGRLRAASVVHADETREGVAGAVREALAVDWDTVEIVNPYGAGGAAERIVAAAEEALSLPMAKPFIDWRGADGR